MTNLLLVTFTYMHIDCVFLEVVQREVIESFLERRL